MAWSRPLAVVLGVTLLVLLAHHLAFRLFAGRAARRHHTLYQEMVRTLWRPTRGVTALLTLMLALPVIPIPSQVEVLTRQALSIALILCVAWVLVAMTHVMEDVTSARYDTSSKDNLVARKMRTRIGVLRRVLTALILIVAASAVLMTFPEVRTLGASLLASAGLLGLVAGLAAQPVLTNLIAGLQIALTQPIRIDDVVIVKGEWGWIEEIDATYVVVRIWDLRRLIVPLSFFLQQPFENWTYKSADLLGYVHVYADYAVGVDALREELERILKATPLWDGQVWNLQVTGSDGHTLQMRALFSATDSANRWDLMVHVREKLWTFLRDRYPEHLPRTRVELAPGAESRSS